jgi:hypothetical protein
VIAVISSLGWLSSHRWDGCHLIAGDRCNLTCADCFNLIAGDRFHFLKATTLPHVKWCT